MKRILSVALGLCLLVLLCASFSGCKKSGESGCVYEINAEYEPETSTLSATLKLNYENRTDGAISELKFNLFPNAYREGAIYQPVSPAYTAAAYYAGKDYGRMEISSVTGGRSWEVAGKDENVLCVYPAETLYPGDKITLDVSFFVKLAKVNHRTGVTAHTVNLGNFFPVLCAYEKDGFYECEYYSDGDPFYAECADYKLTLRLPKGYAAAVGGEILSETALEHGKAYTVSATNARDLAVVLSEEFQVATSEKNGVEVKYYYYDDSTPTVNLMLAAEAIDYYSSTFGKYPYKTYSLVQTGFCYGGMEYPALSMISDRLEGSALAYTIARETAHQWWGVGVGNNPLENAWQDESLAEYSAAAFFENYPDYGFTREGLIESALKSYRDYFDVYSQVFGTTDTRMTRHLSEFISEYEYESISNAKGAVMFDTLRESIGAKRFFGALKKYYADYKFKTASPASLIGCFEAVGVDVAGYFEGFLNGETIL